MELLSKTRIEMGGRRLGRHGARGAGTVFWLARLAVEALAEKFQVVWGPGGGESKGRSPLDPAELSPKKLVYS